MCRLRIMHERSHLMTAGDSDSSSQVVGPTIDAIKSGLESLLPYSTAGASVIPSLAPVAANPILLAPTPAESPLAMLAPVIGMTGMSPAAGIPAASGTSSPGMAPSISAAGEGKHCHSYVIWLASLFVIHANRAQTYE